jgi:hypothetical protein
MCPSNSISHGHADLGDKVDRACSAAVFASMISYRDGAQRRPTVGWLHGWLLSKLWHKHNHKRPTTAAWLENTLALDVVTSACDLTAIWSVLLLLVAKAAASRCYCSSASAMSLMCHPSACVPAASDCAAKSGRRLQLPAVAILRVRRCRRAARGWGGGRVVSQAAGQVYVQRASYGVGILTLSLRC